MRIGITGADGLLGFHARCYLHSINDVPEVKLATRATFVSTLSLTHSSAASMASSISPASIAPGSRHRGWQCCHRQAVG